MFIPQDIRQAVAANAAPTVIAPAVTTTVAQSSSDMGDSFEAEVFQRTGVSDIINAHMDAVRASSRVTEQVKTVMPRYFAGKSTGEIDGIAISIDGKHVEIMEVKDYNFKRNGMFPHEAAFDQAIGGAVAIQSGNGRNPVKGFEAFETYTITAISRWRYDTDRVDSKTFTATEIAEMGHSYTK